MTQKEKRSYLYNTLQGNWVFRGLKRSSIRKFVTDNCPSAVEEYAARPQRDPRFGLTKAVAQIVKARKLSS